MSHIYDINNPESQKSDNEKFRDRYKVSDKDKLPLPEKKNSSTEAGDERGGNGRTFNHSER